MQCRLTVHCVVSPGVYSVKSIRGNGCESHGIAAERLLRVKWSYLLLNPRAFMCSCEIGIAGSIPLCYASRDSWI